MVTTVFVDDYVSGNKNHLVFGSEEMSVIENYWHVKDELLVGLSGTTLFKDLTTWSELRPIHFMVLLTQNFNSMDDLTPAQRSSGIDPTMASFNLLVSGLIRCIEIQADSSVELLRIQRITADHINFDYQAALHLQFDYRPKEGKGLKVVVDNTKDEK